MNKQKARKTRIVAEPAKPKPLTASELCWSGAAEAMKYGAARDAQRVTRADYHAVNKARDLFAGFTDQQMAVALLILMVDLGRRIEGVANPTLVTKNTVNQNAH